MNSLSNEQRGQTGWIGVEKCELVLQRALNKAQNFSLDIGFVDDRILHDRLVEQGPDACGDRRVGLTGDGLQCFDVVAIAFTGQGIGDGG